MHVITESKVSVVGQTVFTPHPVYELPDDGTDAERLGATAAKCCYDSFGKDGRSVIDNQRAIIETKHGSVIEHSYVSLLIEGVTRALTLELNRHRQLNISQRSTRYTREDAGAIVLDPFYADVWKRYGLSWNDTGGVVLPTAYNGFGTTDLPTDLALVVRFVTHCARMIAEYRKQVEDLIIINPENLEKVALRKWARGKARNLLPHALETRGVWTANHRALRWLIELRSGRHAEAEIRVLANKILETVRPLAPTYYEDFEMTGVFQGIPEWTPKHSKI